MAILKKILLIGCGQFGRAAHLPALKQPRYDGKIQLAAIADLPGTLAELPAVLEQRKFDPKTVKLIGVSKESDLDRILPGKLEVDACIISTSSETHHRYAQWALSQGLPTLVDKPLSYIVGAGTDPKKAGEIFSSDYLGLLALAQKNGVDNFMLGTQKRYQTTFRETAARIRTVFERTGAPVTNVQCLTSDGAWLLPAEYHIPWIQEFHKGGGKITHTGYHFLDIVPWLMRHASSGASQPISYGWITADFFRPTDALALLGSENYRRMFHADLPGSPGPGLIEPIDVNAEISIVLFDGRNNKRAKLNFCLLHEGLSLRVTNKEEEAYSRRTKIDVLSLTQGPVFFAQARRIAKFLPDLLEPGDLGGPNHSELSFISNPHLTGLPPLEVIHPTSTDSEFGCSDDELPVRNFLDRLLNPGTPIISPVSDHAVGIKILSAAYQSAALSFRASDNQPQPVKVTFSESDWQLPPPG